MPSRPAPGRDSAFVGVRDEKLSGIMRGMTTTKLLLLALAVMGSAAAIVGILWSSRQNVLEDTDGVPYFNPASGWAKHRGPVVGVAGVMVSLAATVLGLAATP